MTARRFILLLAGLAVLAVAALYAVRSSNDASASDGTAVEVEKSTQATATATQGNLAATKEFRAKVSFGEPWSLGATPQGIVTKSHPAGTVIRPGKELVRVDDKPVVLADGEMPLFRELQRVNTNARDENNKRQKLLEGQDVRQLQDFLLRNGHDDNDKLEADGIFGLSTEKAVKAWQEDNGLSPTGRIDASQMVFSAEPVRISAELRVGSVFTSLEVTNAAAVVAIDTNNRDRSLLAPGTEVGIELPNGDRFEGITRDQKQRIGDDGSPVWQTTVSTSSELAAEATAATVDVTTVKVEDATIVPASALLALAEGGFAVEVVTADGTSLVKVELDEILDGQAAIRGDVEAGDTLVVPQ